MTVPLEGAWLVHVWTDKSGTSTAPPTTAWTPPSNLTQRGAVYGTGTGTASAMLADTNGPVAGGHLCRGLRHH